MFLLDKLIFIYIYRYIIVRAMRRGSKTLAVFLEAIQLVGA